MREYNQYDDISDCYIGEIKYVKVRSKDSIVFVFDDGESFCVYSSNKHRMDLIIDEDFYSLPMDYQKVQDRFVYQDIEVFDTKWKQYQKKLKIESINKEKEYEEAEKPETKTVNFKDCYGTSIKDAYEKFKKWDDSICNNGWKEWIKR